MISIRGRAATTRRVATALASGLILATGSIAAASPAAAAGAVPPEPRGGAVATLDGLAVHGEAIIHEGDERLSTGAGLFEMSVAGGGSLQTYSVDMHNVAQQQAQYQENAWKTSSLHNNPDAGKIQWILRNSYPQVNDLTELAKKAGAGKLTPQSAAAGTQVAIWRYSEHAEVTAVDKGAQKLASYLYDQAVREKEPAASLELSTPAVSGKPGERLGPVKVRTAARNATLAPLPESTASGVRITDKSGEAVTTVRDGDRVYLEVPEDAEDGFTSMTIEAATTVPVGRVFTSLGDEGVSQAQILAGSSEATATASVAASWAAEGPAPAVTTTRNCAARALDVTVVNHGDQPFDFSLGERESQVESGATETMSVPIAEDQAYRINVTGPHGHHETFAGVLDCATKASVPAEDPGLSVQTEPVTVGGGDGEPNLAETGSNSNAPLLVGIALAMLVLGGVAMLMVRRTKPEDEEAEGEKKPESADEDGAAAHQQEKGADAAKQAGAEEERPVAEESGTPAPKPAADEDGARSED